MCLLGIYNIKTGQNTVLRGLIAEEFARYMLSQRFPILIERPRVILDYLDELSLNNDRVSFLSKFQKTMDFFGIGPIMNGDSNQFNTKDMMYKFFYEAEGLGRFLSSNERTDPLRGIIIEVKSRTSINSWTPFQYSFSSNQESMLAESRRFGFKVMLCGVTLENNWNISAIVTDEKGKILTENFLIPT